MISPNEIPTKLPDRYSSVLLVLVGVLVCLIVAGLAGVRLNLTTSMQSGWYRVVGEPTALRRGDIVLACLPRNMAAFAHSRGYVPRGGNCPRRLAPVGKFVMALPGDTVMITRWGMSVNGVAVPYSRRLDRDGSGRQLPKLPDGRSIVSPHFIWLVGSSERSFDSRYIGPVEQANVRARIDRF